LLVKSATARKQNMTEPKQHRPMHATVSL
jgi:hypothetical protein